METKTLWKPSPTVCRCCLAEGCYKDISTEYFWMGKKEIYADMLKDTFDVNIAYAQTGGPNSNSRLICDQCISRLRHAFEFKRQVQECEKMFINHLAPGSAGEDIECEFERPQTSIKLESVKVEKDLSDDDDGYEPPSFLDDEDDDLDDAPLTKFASKAPKSEVESVLSMLGKAKLTVKRISTTKAKSETPAKKTKTIQVKPSSTSTSKSASKTAPKTAKKKGNEPIIPGASKSKHSKETSKILKRNTKILLQYTTVYPFKVGSGNQILCLHCDDKFDDAQSFRNHFDTMHSSCNEEQKRNTRSATRVDVTNLRCKICNEPKSSLPEALTHLSIDHRVDANVKLGSELIPIKLDTNGYACLMCSKKFSGLKELSNHSGNHFTRYMCHLCGKDFQSPSGYKLHVKIHHSDIQNYCRICNKGFPSVVAKKQHLETSKKCMPFKCRLCPEGFMFWERREQHLVEAHGHAKRIFRCTECEEQFEKRILLYLHFKKFHTDDLKCQYCGKRYATSHAFNCHVANHTGIRSFKCELCDKAFATHKTLAKHKIIHDDSKKLGCPVCKKLFVCRSRLTQHIQKHHPRFFVPKQDGNQTM